MNAYIVQSINIIQFYFTYLQAQASLDMNTQDEDF